MKAVFFALMGMSLAISAAIPASAGTVNGTEIAGTKYASTKCKPPAAPGLVIRTMKSYAAFTKAAAAHNEFSAAVDDYSKCRQEELNADVVVLRDQASADINALVKLSNDEAAELTAKKAELEKKPGGN